MKEQDGVNSRPSRGEVWHILVMIQTKISTGKLCKEETAHTHITYTSKSKSKSYTYHIHISQRAPVATSPSPNYFAPAVCLCGYRDKIILALLSGCYLRPRGRGTNLGEKNVLLIMDTKNAEFKSHEDS